MDVAGHLAQFVWHGSEFSTNHLVGVALSIELRFDRRSSKLEYRADLDVLNGRELIAVEARAPVVDRIVAEDVARLPYVPCAMPSTPLKDFQVGVVGALSEVTLSLDLSWRTTVPVDVGHDRLVPDLETHKPELGEIRRYEGADVLADVRSPLLQGLLRPAWKVVAPELPPLALVLTVRCDCKHIVVARHDSEGRHVVRIVRVGPSDSRFENSTRYGGLWRSSSAYSSNRRRPPLTRALLPPT